MKGISNAIVLFIVVLEGYGSSAIDINTTIRTSNQYDHVILLKRSESWCSTDGILSDSVDTHSFGVGESTVLISVVDGDTIGTWLCIDVPPDRYIRNWYSVHAITISCSDCWCLTCWNSNSSRCTTGRCHSTDSCRCSHHTIWNCYWASNGISLKQR